MKQEDQAKVPAFISIVFHQYVAPGFLQDGIDECIKFIKPGAIESQLKENHLGYIATLDLKIVGIIEVRNNDPIALFFVHSRFHRKGTGKWHPFGYLGLAP